jgi:hypothetical protein
MKLEALVEQLGLEPLTAKDKLDVTVTGGYASDLLSCAMAKAQAGNIWVTVQSHPNIVAVASLLNLAAIVITENMTPDPATLEKGGQEGVPLLLTPDTTYVTVCKLYDQGVHGVD